MNIWVWCELVCYGCSKVSEGRHTNGNTVPRGMLVKTARAAGWVESRVHDGEIYCSRRCREQKEGG